jgi:UPF0755 protein
MSTPPNKPKYGIWEYIAYIASTAFFLVLGVFFALLVLLRKVFADMSLTRITAVLVGIILVIGIFSYSRYNSKVDLGQRVVTVIIERGDGFNKVADELLSAGVVDSKLMLKIPARFRGLDKRLTVGRYDFTGENSCRTVLDKLARADFLKIKVTIPEGTTIWGAASILQRQMGFDSAQTVAFNTDSAFLAEFKLPCLEGYLYPETYFFPWGGSARSVLAEMIDLFHATTDSIWPAAIVNGLSRHEAIILASIIEAETKLSGEHGKVSSVYNNRLARGMKLDADPTVIYGLGGLDRPLWTRDLQKPSPYNTYMNKGLPPTPINSPGLVSIRAALNPERTDYLFFVADNTGGHVFSRTNAEHNGAKRRIRSQSDSGK